MLFFTHLVAFSAIVVSITHGAPLSLAPHGESANPGDWPSPATLQKILATGPDKSAFWAGKNGGVSVYVSARDAALKDGRTTLENSLALGGAIMPSFPIDDPVALAKWDQAAGTMAKLAQGVVFAYIGGEKRPDNSFDRLELPLLKANPKVTQIVQVNLLTGAHTTIFPRASIRDLVSF